MVIYNLNYIQCTTAPSRSGGSVRGARPPLRQQLEEHDAQRDVDEQHQQHQLLSGEPVLHTQLYAMIDDYDMNYNICVTTQRRTSLPFYESIKKMYSLEYSIIIYRALNFALLNVRIIAK